MESKMSRERKLIKGMAKRARDFFQSLADLMKGYLADAEDVKEPVPLKKSKSTSKKSKKKASAAAAEVPVSKKASKQKGGSKKVEKDPNAPKKPLPAFLLFSNYKRRLMKEGGVTLPLKDRLAQIESEWARMSKAEKDVSFGNFERRQTN